METDKNINITDALPDISIPGINVSAGITLCGNTEAYLELLCDVYGIIDKKCQEVENYLKKGDIRNFTTTVHALKTTCRMMGHTDLSESFFELEKLGKENDTEKAASLTPDVLDRFRSLQPLLEPYSVKAAIDKIPFEATAVSELLSEIIEATSDFDINRAEEAMNKLLTYECDKELSDALNKLSELVNDLDYDEASELASGLKEKL